VYTWIGLRLGPKLRLEVDPEDVLQEVACRAFARRATFDPTRGPFRAWIFGIARNLLLSSLEQLTVSGRADREWLSTGGLATVPDGATSVSQRILRDDSIARFLAHVETLPDDDRTMVVRRGLAGQEHGEVAAALGIEPSTAAKRWSRLRDRLRDEMSGLDLVD
ncbi:MAG: sigma-70 family RNA polymerase sigma factor, partial [Planctomycetota bacterium]